MSWPLYPTNPTDRAVAVWRTEVLTRHAAGTGGPPLRPCDVGHDSETWVLPVALYDMLAASIDRVGIIPNLYFAAPYAPLMPASLEGHVMMASWAWATVGQRWWLQLSTVGLDDYVSLTAFRRGEVKAVDGQTPAVGTPHEKQKALRWPEYSRRLGLVRANA